MKPFDQDPVPYLFIGFIVLFILCMIYVYTFKRYKFIKTIKTGDYIGFLNVDFRCGYVYKIENGVYYIYVRGMCDSVRYYECSKHSLFEPNTI